jgi:hypothetical protein
MNCQIASLPNLNEKHIALVLEHESNPIYFRYLWAIILNAHNQGSHVTIFDCDWDISEFTKKAHDQYRKTSISKIRDEFLETLAYKTNNAVKIVKIKTDEIKVEKKDVLGIVDFSTADEKHLQFGNSMRSVFARNYLSSSNFTLKGSRMKKQFRIYAHSFLIMEKVCQKVYSPNNFDLILIANGRFPGQTAMRLVAESLSIEFYFYEHGMPKGQRFHFAPFQTQEFQKMQQWIRSEFIPENQERSEEVYEFSKKWLERQENDVSQNPFLNLETRSDSAVAPSQINPLAVIFNSSIDERYSNLGVDLNGWKSQKQATAAFAKRLREQGFHVIVRIHPNTANKSWWDLVNIANDLEENGIDYILPWNGPSSYALLREATVVLTWGSTISMEALAKGIPTIVFGRTMYDEIAGAHIVNPDSLSKIDFTKLDSQNSAFGFLAAYINKHWGYKLTEYCSESDLLLLDNMITSREVKQHSHTLLFSEKNYVQRTRVFASDFFILLRKLRRGRYSTPNDFRRFISLFFGFRIANKTADYFVKLLLRLGILCKDAEISI